MDMYEGFYSVVYRGQTDWGAAVIVLLNGFVTGSDVTGISYDGVYVVDDLNRQAILRITLSVPPGIALVTGLPAHPHPYAFNIEVPVPETIGSRDFETQVQVLNGIVQVRLHKLRNFPKR